MILCHYIIDMGLIFGDFKQLLSNDQLVGNYLQTTWENIKSVKTWLLRKKQNQILDDGRKLNMPKMTTV